MHNERKLWFSCDLQCQKFNSCWIRAEWKRRLDSSWFQWWPINGRLFQELATLEIIRGLEPKCVSRIDSGIVTGGSALIGQFFFPVASNSLRSLCHSLLGLVSLIPSRFFNGEYMQTSLLYISVLFQFTSIDEYLESYVFEISSCLRTKVRLIHEKTKAIFSNWECDLNQIGSKSIWQETKHKAYDLFNGSNFKWDKKFV